MSEEEFYLIDLKSKFDKIKPNTYYLSYSGGKDSHFLYWFIKEYLKRNDIKIVGINTYMEHHEIRDRIFKNSDIVLYPKLKPMEIKEKYGIPCFSKEQDFYIYYYQNAIRKGKKPSKTIQEKIDGTYRTGFCLSKKAREYVLSGKTHKITHLCCHYLKKEPARQFEKETGLKPILGIRNSESAMRKQQYKSCFTNNGKFIPLHDLSDELLDSANESITNILKAYYGCETITDTINMISVFCVDRITPDFQKLVNSNVQQGFKNGRLPVGVSFGGKNIYIAKQKDGFAITKYKRLRREFFDIMDLQNINK